jgi:type IV fimbrial biogenesis protein FimT
MKNGMRSRPRGFTLIELLVVIAIAAVLATLVVPSFRAMAANQALGGATSDLMAASLQARSMALKTNRRVVVEPASSSDWRTGWNVYVDVNQNGSYDSGSDTLVVTHEALASDIAIDSANTTMTIFGYDSSGFMLRGGVFPLNGAVSLKSSYTARNKRLIVDTTGRARLCDTSIPPGCT